MKKMVFSDIDKTLSINGIISKSNIIAIEKYIKTGGIFVLTTGRSVSYTKKLIKNIKGIRYIICTNGSIIYDLKEEKVIYSNKISFDTINKIYNLCNENFKLVLTGIDVDLVNKDSLENQKLISNIDDSINTTQLIISTSLKDKILSIEKVINDISSVKVINKSRSLYDSSYIDNGNYWLDIIPCNINKGFAVLMLCKILNINLDDTVRIGDDLNDLPMFFDKGINIAVFNGIKLLKDKADYVTLSCAEDGIAYALYKIINDEL